MSVSCAESVRTTQSLLMICSGFAHLHYHFLQTTSTRYDMASVPNPIVACQRFGLRQQGLHIRLDGSFQIISPRMIESIENEARRLSQMSSGSESYPDSAFFLFIFFFSYFLRHPWPDNILFITLQIPDPSNLRSMLHAVRQIWFSYQSSDHVGDSTDLIVRRIPRTSPRSFHSHYDAAGASQPVARRPPL